MSKTGLRQTVLGEVLLAWRESKHYNIRGAADFMGISASTLSRIENGEVTPDAGTLLSILNWLMKGKNGSNQGNQGES